MLQHGTVPDNAIVKMAQTFRSGTNDIDALDYVDMFLADEQQTSLDELTEIYVLVNFRPVLTNKNWRMDCGVAGYDNTFGLPPFFPTWLRFEDYIYRCGSSRTAFAPLTSMPPRTTPRATTCAIRRPRRSSMRKCPTC